MKNYAKFFGMIMIVVSVAFSGILYAQSTPADSSKSTTAASAPASSNPAVEPAPSAQKDKPVGDLQYKTDDSGKWGLLGLLGLLGLFGLRRSDRSK
jgi:MYXO-CTERM domain-containing protein